mmetsp:Transcript_6345/g.12638  ORF Transcript_6345/g.12638 Transcript_6345/m.12638 type:complete len:225 (-) Transcript_6345:846-1520(-)
MPRMTLGTHVRLYYFFFFLTDIISISGWFDRSNVGVPEMPLNHAPQPPPALQVVDEPEREVVRQHVQRAVRPQRADDGERLPVAIPRVPAVAVAHRPPPIRVGSRVHPVVRDEKDVARAQERLEPRNRRASAREGLREPAKQRVVEGRGQTDRLHGPEVLVDGGRPQGELPRALDLQEQVVGHRSMRGRPALLPPAEEGLCGVAGEQPAQIEQPVLVLDRSGAV